MSSFLRLQCLLSGVLIEHRYYFRNKVKQYCFNLTSWTTNTWKFYSNHNICKVSTILMNHQKLIVRFAGFVKEIWYINAFPAITRIHLLLQCNKIYFRNKLILLYDRIYGKGIVYDKNAMLIVILAMKKHFVSRKFSPVVKYKLHCF